MSRTRDRRTVRWSFSLAGGKYVYFVRDRMAADGVRMQLVVASARAQVHYEESRRRYESRKDSRIAVLGDGRRLPVSRAGYDRLKSLLDQRG